MTPAELLVLALVRGHVAASAAILVIFLVRAVGRGWIGPELTYRLWMLAPIAFGISLFPTLEEVRSRAAAGGGPSPALVAPLIGQAPLVLLVFFGGMLALAAMFLVRERRFARAARAGVAGPAVIGVFWPRVVTPDGFEQQFTADERAMIRTHERVHIASGHPRDNLVIAMVRTVGWFNPLVHAAAAAARLDQELACDAAVLERHASNRRLYGETLLKAHVGGPSSPLACAFTAGALHPLELRFRMLSRPPATLKQYLGGAAVVAGVGFLLIAALWSLAPADLAWSPISPY